MAAVQANPQHHEAANELGYALRRMGQYSQAIQWYDHALELQPKFLEAIEYRGEAYLAVGKIDAAKQAYMELFRNDPELAAQAWTEPDPLTDRERQVLRFCAEGWSNARIAAELGLHEGTVRNYVSEAISKLDATNRVDAARIARNKGWL